MSERSRQQDRTMEILIQGEKLVGFLTKAGLGPKEIQIYLFLLDNGPLSISGLAQRLHIPRTTIYENVEKLKDKKLIYFSLERGKKLINPEGLTKIQSLFLQKQFDLQSRLGQLTQLNRSFGDLITAMTNSSGVVQAFRHYEGKEDVFSVYLAAMKSDEAYSFTDLEQYYNLFPDTIEIWRDALRSNPNRILQTITNDSPLARNIARENDILRQNYYSSFLRNMYAVQEIDLHFYGGSSVAVFDLNRLSPKAVVITSPILFMQLKMMHQLVKCLLDG